MNAADQNSNNGKSRRVVVIYLGQGAGHLIPTVELGRLLVSHGFAVTIVLHGQPPDNDVTIGTSAFLLFHYIPVEVPSLPSSATEGDHVARFFELGRASNTLLREFLQSAASPAALVLDFFCYSSADIGAEAGIPTYFFYAGGAAGLAFLLHLPIIHAQNAASFRDLGGEPVHVPGIPPIPANDLPAALLDRRSLSYSHFLAVSEQLRKSLGIIVNSYRSLEPRATDAIVSGLCMPPGHMAPPIYSIGPLIKPAEEKKHGEEQWRSQK